MKTSTKRRVLGVLDRMIQTVDAAVKCGGRGGKPGPCPDHGGGGEHADSHLQHGSGQEVGSGGHAGDHVFKGEPARIDGHDTMTRFTTADGQWTKERQALHDKIISHFMSGSTPVANPEAHMMGGGPASGKSSVIGTGAINTPSNIVKIDPDAIKKHIPEYNERLKAGDIGAAGFAHEESSYLSKRILDESAKRSHHTVLDGTGDGGIDGLAEKIGMMRQTGAKVHAHYITCDTNEAVRRAKKRAEDPKSDSYGRLPNETFVRNCHKNVSSIVPEAIRRGLFDTFALYDTNGPVKKIASAKGTELEIHDHDAWNRFLAKANE